MSDAATPGGNRLPAAFLSHGSPTSLLEKDQYSEALAQFGAELPKPTAIVAFADSWRTPGAVRVTAAARHVNLRKFNGAPPALSGFTYKPAGDPELARRIVDLLKGAGFEAFPDQVRALDPGTWIPLSMAYPEADVPVVQVSLPQDAEPAQLIAIGAALSGLRDEGILLMAGGGAGDSLDLRRLERKHAPVEPWAIEFDEWVEGRIAALDRQALADFREDAPHADEAVPGSLPIDPLLVVMGSSGQGEAVKTVYEGVHHGKLSMRSFTIGNA